MSGTRSGRCWKTGLDSSRDYQTPTRHALLGSGRPPKTALRSSDLSGNGGLVAACLTAVWEYSGSKLTAGGYLYHDSHCDTHIRGQHALTAVPKSTQPSTACGKVKWVSAFGLSNNNKWWCWVQTIAAFTGGLTVKAGWLGLRSSSYLALSLQSSNEWGNSCNDFAMMTAQ